MRPEESHREPGIFLGQIKKKRGGGTESGDFCHCLHKPVCQNQPVGVGQPMEVGSLWGRGSQEGRRGMVGRGRVFRTDISLDRIISHESSLRPGVYSRI